MYHNCSSGGYTRGSRSRSNSGTNQNNRSHGLDPLIPLIYTVHDRAGNSFGKKLTKRIVGVLGNIGDRLVIGSLVRLGYRGDFFLGIILIGKRTTVGEEDFAYKMSSGRRNNLYVAIISFLYLEVKKNSAPQNEVRRNAVYK